MSTSVKNTADLRKMLLETIEGVRKGKVDHHQARAISDLSSRILQSARLDLDVVRMAAIDPNSQAPSSTSLMGEPKPQRRLAIASGKRKAA